jgi:ABC-type dipeptide/oligopeptide/nickel transport system ATPase component
MNGNPLLQISDLSITIRGQQILNRLTLGLANGETLGLVGESGAGKTMTALAILGLLPRDAVITKGRIHFQTRDLLDLTQRELRQVRGSEIGVVFQESRAALNPLMRIDEQISEGMRFKLGYSKARALEESGRMLEAVGLQDPERCLHAYPHQLSGGMRQRVLIAAALSCRPRILICDEITSSVDTIVQNRLLSLMELLKDDTGIAILLITHNLRIARRMANRIAVIMQGTIIEEGNVEDIFDRPSHDFTRSLIASAPGVERR